MEIDYKRYNHKSSLTFVGPPV